MSYDSPFKLRVWHDKNMQMVQTFCHNQGGAMWYAAGNSFGWAWINEDYDGWHVDNPKPSPADVSPVMRWTGLKDKEGEDIWEGDIVRVPIATHPFAEQSYILGMVKWSQESCSFYIPGTPAFGVPKTTSVKVVGNIHQHSELLAT